MQNQTWDPYGEDSIWQTYINAYPNPSYQSFSLFVQNLENQARFADELAQIRRHKKLTASKKTSWRLYYFLSIAGGIYALCSGFDGMVSVLSLLTPQLYLGVIITLGLLSAISALGIFIARDLPSIMDSLNLAHSPYHSAVDTYLYHLQRFNQQSTEENWKPGAQFYQQVRTAEQLSKIFADKEVLNGIRKSSWWVQVQAHVVTGIGAILFFSDGFFIGENLALLCASVLASSQLLAFTLAISVLMGIFALAAYWYVERCSMHDYLLNHVATDEYLRQEHAAQNTGLLKKLSIFRPKQDFMQSCSFGPQWAC